MTEFELEEAICRAFPELLSDLCREGYTIKSRQAILFGRRLDLVLQTNDGRDCIIEVKVGAPSLPDVCDQILDYAKCWRFRSRKVTNPCLIVISNTIPERTKAELLKRNIEYRIISESEVLSALRIGQGQKPVERGLRLTPEITQEIRQRLSDAKVIHVPDDMKFERPWDHEKAFLALIKRGEKYKDLWKKNIYVRLDKQIKNSAVLYSPLASPQGGGPLHLNPRSASWNESLFHKIAPYIVRALAVIALRLARHPRIAIQHFGSTFRVTVKPRNQGQVS
jgi:hypothetical protein